MSHNFASSINTLYLLQNELVKQEKDNSKDNSHHKIIESSPSEKKMLSEYP